MKKKIPRYWRLNNRYVTHHDAALEFRYTEVGASCFVLFHVHCLQSPSLMHFGVLACACTRVCVYVFVCVCMHVCVCLVVCVYACVYVPGYEMRYLDLSI